MMPRTKLITPHYLHYHEFVLNIHCYKHNFSYKVPLGNGKIVTLDLNSQTIVKISKYKIMATKGVT